jgi:hypothetical protein
MSSGSMERAMAQFRAVDPGFRTRLQLLTAPPPVTLPPVTLPAFKWSSFGAVRFGMPGKLAAYPSRVAHARAHRLAAERARRNRRCARKGRPEPGGLQSARPVTWTMSIDVGGFTAAMEGVGVALRRFGESVTAITQARIESFDLHRLMSAYEIEPAGETSGPDTSHCAGRGGSWSDLMSRIDELTEET